MFGKDIVGRQRGRILNISSMGVFIPDPYSYVYGPTKAYDLFLSEAMYGELQGSGVTVTALSRAIAAWQKSLFLRKFEFDSCFPCQNERTGFCLYIEQNPVFSVYALSFVHFKKRQSERYIAVRVTRRGKVGYISRNKCYNYSLIHRYEGKQDRVPGGKAVKSAGMETENVFVLKSMKYPISV